MEGQISAKLYISGFAEKYRAAWYEERLCLSRFRVEGLGDHSSVHTNIKPSEPPFPIGGLVYCVAMVHVRGGGCLTLLVQSGEQEPLQSS